MRKFLYYVLWVAIITGCTQRSSRKSDTEVSFVFNYLSNSIYLQKLNYDSIESSFKKILLENEVENSDFRFIVEIQIYLDSNLVGVMGIFSGSDNYYQKGIYLKPKILHKPSEIDQKILVKINNIEYLSEPMDCETVLHKNSQELILGDKLFIELLSEIQNKHSLKFKAIYKYKGINKVSEQLVTKDKYELNSLKKNKYFMDESSLYFSLYSKHEELDKSYTITGKKNSIPYLLFDFGENCYSALTLNDHENASLNSVSFYPTYMDCVSTILPVDSNSIDLISFSKGKNLGVNGLKMTFHEGKMLFYCSQTSLIYAIFKKNKKPFKVKYKYKNGTEVEEMFGYDSGNFQ